MMSLSPCVRESIATSPGLCAGHELKPTEERVRSVTSIRQGWRRHGDFTAKEVTPRHTVGICCSLPRGPSRGSGAAPTSDVGQLAEVLVVFVVAPFALADGPQALNELNGLDPFHHFEAELVLDPQSQRRPVQLAQRREVH